MREGLLVYRIDLKFVGKTKPGSSDVQEEEMVKMKIFAREDRTEI